MLLLLVLDSVMLVANKKTKSLVLHPSLLLYIASAKLQDESQEFLIKHPEILLLVVDVVQLVLAEFCSAGNSSYY